MKTRTAACTALLALAALTAGCSSDTSDDKAQSKPSTASGSKTPAKATTKPGPLKLGTGTHWTDTDNDGSPIGGTTTAIAYTQPAKDVDLPDDVADFPHPDWVTLEVKVCADKDSTTVLVGQTSWSLRFPDDSRVKAPGLSGSGVPKPEYATDDGAAIQPGDCLRGKITYSVAHGTRPTRVIYSPGGRNPVEWVIPKA